MFHEMRYIYQVYKEKSFSKAAKKLYISQPSLSLMVKKAEERLGTPLFDRSISPIRLTPAGEEYIRSVEQIMAVEDHFRQYLSSADDCLTGTLSLGGTTFFTSYVLPPLISEFSTRFPGVEILIHETHTALLEKELQEYVKSHTAPYKYPRVVEFLPELPKTISGKIRRVALREKDNANK